MVYELFIGPIPEGLTIDHLCRNRACVNPTHLEPVTMAENLLRSPIAPSTINGAKTYCKRGHPLVEGNIYRYRGMRNCVMCRRQHVRDWRREHPEHDEYRARKLKRAAERAEQATP